MAYYPFAFEPEYSGTESEPDSLSESDLDEVNNDDRLGHTDWCICGNCRVMNTEKECICCKEIVQAMDKIENANVNCIIDHFDFEIVCLHPEVLRTAMIARADIRRDDINQPIPNSALRHQAYRQFTYWLHNKLGKHVRRVIPSCAVWKIRDEFPSEDGNYVGFLESQPEF